MDKRKDLRQFYQSKDEQAMKVQQYQQRTAQINGLEDTVVKAFNALIRYMDGTTTKTEVTNQLKSISTPDVDKVVQAVSNLRADILTNKLDLKPVLEALNSLKREITLIPAKMPKAPEAKDTVTVENLDQITFDTTDLEKAIKELKLDPKIDVKAPVVNVEATDLSPIKDSMLQVLEAIKAQKPVEIPKTDLSKLEKASEAHTKQLEEANKHLKKIVEKPVGGGGGGGGNGTPYISTDSLSVYANAIPSTSVPSITAVTVVNPDGTDIGGGSGGDLATAAKGTTTAGNPTSTAASSDRQLLDVTLRDTSGAPVAVGGGTQYADGAARGTATGTLLMGDDGTNIQAVKANPLSTQLVSTDVGVVTNSVIHGLTTAGGGTYVDVKVNPSGSLSTASTINDGTDTLLITAAGEANVIATAQPGVDIGDVTINNASGASAVNIQDGGNSITIDGSITTVSTVTNLSQMNGSAISMNTGVRDAGTQRVTIATNDVVPVTDNGGSLTVDGTVTANAGTGTFTVAGAVTNTVLSVVGGGTEATAQRVTIANDSTGVLSVDDNGSSLTIDAPVGTPAFVRLSDGASAITTLPVSLASVPSHAVTNAGIFATQATASATGGYTPGKLVSAASTNATSVKASAGTLGFLTASNVNASPRYLKLYNKASAPTVGTDVPVFTFIIPGNTSGAGTNIPIPPQGLNFSTGIAFATTTGATDADTGAVASAEIIINYGTI